MKRISSSSILKTAAFALIALLGMRAMFTAHTTTPPNAPMSSQPRQRGLPQLTLILMLVVIGLIIIWTLPMSNPPTQSVVIINGNLVGFIGFSMALDSSGIAYIAYYDSAAQALRLARCNNNTTCNASTVVTVDSGGTSPGRDGKSIALTSAGIPIIAYYDAFNGDLKLAYCNSTACNAPTIVTVDSAGFVGQEPSLRLTSGDIPVISYFDTSFDDLKLARCESSTTCNFPSIVTVDNSANDVGEYNSLQLDSNGVALISYLNNTDRTLNFAHCNNIACNAPTLRLLDSNTQTGLQTSMILRGGDPLIAHRNHTLSTMLLVICDDPTCATYTSSTLQTQAYHPSIALDTNGFPVIAYLGIIGAGNPDLMLLRCIDLNCTNPISTTLEGGSTNIQGKSVV